MLFIIIIIIIILKGFYNCQFLLSFYFGIFVMIWN